MSEAAVAGAELARQRGRLALLTQMMEAFSRLHALDDGWLALTLARIANAMEAQAAAVFMLDQGADAASGQLVCRAQIGAPRLQDLAMPSNQGAIGRCLASRKALLDAGIAAAEMARQAWVQAPREPPLLLCAPLAAQDRSFGVVVLLTCPASALGAEQDLDTLAALASAAALALVNAQLAEERAGQERLRRELELAGQVQRNLLPRDVPPDGAVHGYSRPARGVSGDFYDLLVLPDGRTVFALADVSGKGMNAALIMVKAATLFRSWARRVSDPGRLLARIEAELCETMTMGMFVTMVVGLYDPRLRTVRLSNAGHEPPLLRGADGRYSEFPASDPPLGVVCKLENNRYRETTIAIADGALYLYTDGATEGRLADGGIAGGAGVRSLIERHRELAADARLAAMAAHYGDELRDDLTWLVVEDGQAARRQQRARPRRRSARVLVAQSIPAQSDQLKIVRRLIQAAARQAGAGGEWAADLALAVDEACQNIIRHGYAGEARGRIQLSVRREDGMLKVELEDDAPPVAADDCRGRALGELRPGGLGTYFMQRLTDGVRFLKPRIGSGNRLVLSKRLGTTDGDHAR